MQNIFKKLNPEIKKKLKECKLLVLDFDGVLTENGVSIDESGVEMVRCNRSDGLGLSLLREHGGTDALILSTDLNPVVTARAKKLKIPVIQIRPSKKEALLTELNTRGISPKNACYVGNDFIDIDCMKSVGLAVAVADAYPQVKKIADYVTATNGGHGAVREICELILYAKKKHPYP